MSERIYQWSYRAMVGVFFFSLALLLLVREVVPFVSVAATDGGTFPSLVLLKHTDEVVPVGTRVVLPGESGVVTYRVIEEARSSGVRTYSLQSLSSERTHTRAVPVRDVRREVLLSIPVLGVMVKVVTSTLGALAVFVMPLSAMLIDLLLTIPFFARLVERRQVRADEAPVSAHTYAHEYDSGGEMYETEQVQTEGVFARLRHLFSRKKHKEGDDVSDETYEVYDEVERLPHMQYPEYGADNGLSIVVPARKRHIVARPASVHAQ